MIRRDRSKLVWLLGVNLAFFTTGLRLCAMRTDDIAEEDASDWQIFTPRYKNREIHNGNLFNRSGEPTSTEVCYAAFQFISTEMASAGPVLVGPREKNYSIDNCFDEESLAELLQLSDNVARYTVGTPKCSIDHDDPNKRGKMFSPRALAWILLHPDTRAFRFIRRKGDGGLEKNTISFILPLYVKTKRKPWSKCICCLSFDFETHTLYHAVRHTHKLIANKNQYYRTIKSGKIHIGPLIDEDGNAWAGILVQR